MRENLKEITQKANQPENTNNLVQELIELFDMKEKYAENFEKLTTQWEKNDKFYILGANSIFKLVKNWFESIIPLDKDTIIWETTLLEFLEWKENSATATVEVKWKYYYTLFKNFKEKFKKLPKNKQEEIIKKLKELEAKRLNKVKPVLE